MTIDRQWFTQRPAGRYDYLLSHLPSGPVRVLDVGNVGEPGNSSHDHLRRTVHDRGGLVVGCDVSVVAGHPGQVGGDAMRLPFADASFDVVWMGEVLEHLWDPRAALEEARRVLRPAGLVVLTTPNALAFGRIVAWWVRSRDSIGHPDHTLLMTPAVLRNLLDVAGFDVRDMATAKLGLGRHRLPWVPGARRLGTYLLAAAARRP